VYKFQYCNQLVDINILIALEFKMQSELIKEGKQIQTVSDGPQSEEQRNTKFQRTKYYAH